MSHLMQALLADAMRYRQATEARRQVIITRMRRLVKYSDLQRPDVMVAVGKDLMPLIYK